MKDFASSDDPAVQAQLDRLSEPQPGTPVDLRQIREILPRLGQPERRLPPVFHIAGTNGKGSTCAFLRAALEAAGLRVHVFTSPHLVRLNERIRIAGRLIDDALLAALLAEAIDAADPGQVTFFEATAAAAFLAFSRHPADACVIEVGLGGRLDATNVLDAPLVCGIAQLGLDHQDWLGRRLERIAGEKAGIAKPGVPLVTQAYPRGAAERVGRVAARAGARWLPRGHSWYAEADEAILRYSDAAGRLDLPLPRLAGGHQAMNAALAVAMLRHQHALTVPDPALAAAMGRAEWPARLQPLAPGPLRDLLPAEAELWVDGAHNPQAARAVADHFRGRIPAGRPFHIVAGLLDTKDAAGVLRPFFRRRPAAFHAVPVPGHGHHPPATLAALANGAGIAASTAADVADALRRIAREADAARPPIVLVMGSLYLAGELLRANLQPPA